MYKIIVYIFAVLTTFASAYDSYENSIVWVKAPDSQVLLLNQIPAGKLYLKNGNISCIVPYNTFTQASTEFEVLVAYPEVVSWRSFTGGISENTIFSGWMEGEKSYVCRVKMGNLLIPGRLDTQWLCHVAYNGSEISRGEDFEILERNFLGITMNTPLPKQAGIKTFKKVKYSDASNSTPESGLINLFTTFAKYLHGKIPIFNYV